MPAHLPGLARQVWQEETTAAEMVERVTGASPPGQET